MKNKKPGFARFFFHTSSQFMGMKNVRVLLLEKLLTILNLLIQTPSLMRRSVWNGQGTARGGHSA
jgi:hypothetical protein